MKSSWRRRKGAGRVKGVRKSENGRYWKGAQRDGSRGEGCKTLSIRSSATRVKVVCNK